MEFIITDPVYHGAADELDDDHPMAWVTQSCVNCGAIVHAGNNECMQDWFETFYGPMCFDCFSGHRLRMDLPGPGSVIPEGNVMHYWANLEWVAEYFKRQDVWLKECVRARHNGECVPPPPDIIPP